MAAAEGCLEARAFLAAEQRASKLMDAIGRSLWRFLHFPISCSAVQGKFDRAVALLHNFFYPETVKAF